MHIQTMGDLLARHNHRIATASPPRPASPPQPAATPRAPAPASTTKAPRRLEIRRITRGEGYDLFVGGSRAVGVQPRDGGWIVKNVAADCKTTFTDARAADALAARIARMLAPQ